MARETELEMAERHVRQGEIHAARQCELIEHLRTDGHDTKQAEELLTEFEVILTEHRKHLEIARSRQQKNGWKPRAPDTGRRVMNSILERSEEALNDVWARPERGRGHCERLQKTKTSRPRQGAHVGVRERLKQLSERGPGEIPLKRATRLDFYRNGIDRPNTGTATRRQWAQRSA